MQFSKRANNWRWIAGMTLSVLLSWMAFPTFAADLKTYTLQIPLVGTSQTIQICVEPTSGDFQCNGLATYIVLVYEFLIRAAAIFAVMMIVVAGVRWLTAAGEGKRVQEAQKTLTNAIAGLMLVLGSYTLLWAINPNLVHLKTITPRGIKPLALNEIKTESLRPGACCYKLRNAAGSTRFGGGGITEQKMAKKVANSLACSSIIENERSKGVLVTDSGFFCAGDVGSLSEDPTLCWANSDPAGTALSNFCESKKIPIIPADAGQVKSYITSGQIKFVAAKPDGGTGKFYKSGAWARGLGIAPTDMGLPNDSTTDTPLPDEKKVDQRILDAIKLVTETCTFMTITALNETLAPPKAHPEETNPNAGHAGGKAVDIAGNSLCGGSLESCNQRQKDLIQALKSVGYEIGAPGGTKAAPACGATFHESSNHLHIELGPKQN